VLANRQALDDLLDRVRGGESAVLVIRDEAGIGKIAAELCVSPRGQHAPSG
jgi:hypothetical protein